MNKRDYHLSKESENSFVKIKDEKNFHYGGNQHWFRRKNKRINGCGPVAGGNVLAYLSLKGGKYSNLYREKDFSKENFTNFLEEVYNKIKPSPLGLININHFISSILKFGESRGVKLAYRKLGFRDRNFTYFSCYTFIRNALTRDIPVVAFNLDLRKNYLFRWHWMVITRIYYDHGKVKVVVSSWGKRYIADFDRLYSSMKLGGGLVYFY